MPRVRDVGRPGERQGWGHSAVWAEGHSLTPKPCQEVRGKAAPGCLTGVLVLRTHSLAAPNTARGKRGPSEDPQVLGQRDRSSRGSLGGAGSRWGTGAGLDCRDPLAGVQARVGARLLKPAPGGCCCAVRHSKAMATGGLASFWPCSLAPLSSCSHSLSSNAPRSLGISVERADGLSGSEKRKRAWNRESFLCFSVTQEGKGGPMGNPGSFARD